MVPRSLADYVQLHTAIASSYLYSAKVANSCGQLLGLPASLRTSTKTTNSPPLRGNEPATYSKKAARPILVYPARAWGSDDVT